MSDLLERLCQIDSDSTEWSDGGKTCTNWYRNPDGPEAAEEIERLRAVVDAARRYIETDRIQYWNAMRRAILALDEESCPTCDGHGWVTESGHELFCDGTCKNCPVPVQEMCPDCNGTGRRR